MTSTNPDAPESTPQFEAKAGEPGDTRLQPREPSVSDAAFNLFREQTGDARTGNSSGVVAAAGFLIAVVLLLIALEAGADLQQLLLAAIVLTLANVIITLVCSARFRRSRWN
jgi:hypothetical protein